MPFHEIREVSILPASRFTFLQVPAAARAGAIAPCDVTVPAQNTGLGPEKTSFFQALGITTKISRGTIEILVSEQPAAAGEALPCREGGCQSCAGWSSHACSLTLPSGEEDVWRGSAAQCRGFSSHQTWAAGEAQLEELTGELPAGSAGRLRPVSWLRCTCRRAPGLYPPELNSEPVPGVVLCSSSSISCCWKRLFVRCLSFFVHIHPFSTCFLRVMCSSSRLGTKWVPARPPC